MWLYRWEVVEAWQRGVVMNAGVPVRVLGPGRHALWFPDEHTKVDKLPLSYGWIGWNPEREALFGKDVQAVVVAPGEIGLVRVDGVARGFLKPERYLIWQIRHAVEFWTLKTDGVLADEVPVDFRPLATADLLQTIHVHEHERVALFVDGRLHKLLGAGNHPVFCENRKITEVRFSIREQQTTIVGQEVMTQDKVTLRLSLLVTWKVVDAARTVLAVADANAAVYSEAQLVVRRMVAGNSLDKLLEDRNTIAEAMKTDLQGRASDWAVEIVSMDLKDVVLPGEMKVILNQVIEAEKKALANVILRREETAATRSLANTAKLLADNPTLMRLKELEVAKEIAQSVGTVNIVAAGADWAERLPMPLMIPAKGA